MWYNTSLDRKSDNMSDWLCQNWSCIFNESSRDIIWDSTFRRVQLAQFFKNKVFINRCQEESILLYVAISIKNFESFPDLVSNKFKQGGNFSAKVDAML